jgi:hypothetical protein
VDHLDRPELVFAEFVRPSKIVDLKLLLFFTLLNGLDIDMTAGESL